MLQVGKGETTGSSIAIVNSFGDFGAVIVPGANAAFDADAVSLPEDTGVLLLQNELPEAANLALGQLAANAGLHVILNGCPFRALDDAMTPLINSLILSVHEAESLVGHPLSNTRITLDAVEAIAQGVPRVVVFLGGGGMVHGERGHRPEYHPARERRPASMHGTLDFFVGAYASQIAGGSEFEAAAHYAQAAATLFMGTPVERRDLIRATQIRARLGEDDR